MSIHQSPKAGSIPYETDFELECFKLLDVDDDVTTYILKPDTIEAGFFNAEGNLKVFTPVLLICYSDDAYIPLPHMNDAGKSAIDCLKYAKESMTRYVGVP